MIVLVGCSGSGKSTIQSYLTKMYGFESLISYTTRQPRDGEKDGIDYHFISEEEFLKKKEEGFFAEIGKYREWLYGSAKEDCTNNKVAVLTPHGLRQMKRIPELDVVSFYIDVPRRERMVKVLERGDDIEETKRRDGSDTGQFDGIEDEVDFVIKNEGYKNTAEFMAKTIKFMYESKKFNSNQKKKKLTILCDIDEVVDNLTECVIKRYNEKYHDNLDFSSVTEYDLTKFTKPECKDIISEFCNEETIEMMKTPDGAVEAVTDLMKNHNFYFVTATYPHNVGYKHEWLKKHFPLYNKDMLIVTCKKELINGDVLIDDYPKNLSNNVSLNLLFNKPWNAQIQDIKNFHRVYNWGNIMDHIKDLMEE